MEHISTVKVEDIKVGDKFDDGFDTLYTVQEVVPFHGMVSLRVSFDLAGDWLTFEAGSLIGLVNR